jgi:hypothetical protein
MRDRTIFLEETTFPLLITLKKMAREFVHCVFPKLLYPKEDGSELSRCTNSTPYSKLNVT